MVHRQNPKAGGCMSREGRTLPAVKGGVMIARLLGIVLVLVPVGMIIALFWYWLSKKHRQDLTKKEECK